MLAAVLTLTACGGGGHESGVGAHESGAGAHESGAGAGTATTAAPLTGLTATIYQTRMDVPVRQVEVKLRNGSTADLTVRHLRLESTHFDAPMVYGKKGSVISAGRAVDMPVGLSTPVCSGEEGVHTVHLEYELADGSTGEVELEAVDDGGRIADLHAAECFMAEVEDVAEMTISAPPQVRQLGDDLVADVEVEVEPGGGSGLVEVGPVGSTTLLQVVNPRTGETLPEGYDVQLAVTGEQASSFTFTVVPGRCDAHAVAEDKQGTLFPVDVALDGREGRVTMAAPDDVRSALYAFVGEACSP